MGLHYLLKYACLNIKSNKTVCPISIILNKLMDNIPDRISVSANRQGLMI